MQLVKIEVLKKNAKKLYYSNVNINPATKKLRLKLCRKILYRTNYVRSIIEKTAYMESVL